MPGAQQTAPNLALLGDIGHVMDDGLFVFLERQLSRYWNAFFLMGNHEPIGSSWPIAKSRVRGFADRMERLRSLSTIGRFVFLDQTRHDVNDTVTVLGCTLFSRIDPEAAAAISSRFVDFQQIQHWMVQDHIDAHLSDLAWLNAQVSGIPRSEPNRQIAIFTHYSPTLDARAVDVKHIDSPVKSGFATDLSTEECWKNKSVVLWAFGHTHFCCDFTDDLGKKIIANQKGYASFPKKAFDMKRVYFAGETRGPPGLI
ncbi:hypothetical protein QBC46DRAFT_414706 [Diplogelasinospora grovesii]|uniref:Calcineurin-like phosphoesterase domain-containing protein n=1 Tax=Diplogelasinospora grovesii TaxID=303347 RepID=A0AAN6MUY9_9PEZI|nr:hypothetical protein QBC46DRAFT_414706 [Diplogelasinospora grovesii]